MRFWFTVVTVLAVAFALRTGYLMTELDRKDASIAILITKADSMVEARQRDQLTWEDKEKVTQTYIKSLEEYLRPVVMVEGVPVSIDQHFRIGEWDYVVRTHHPGCGNEASKTILTDNNGSAVLPADLTDLTATVKTPWGVMRWHGNPLSFTRLPDNRGWFPVVEKTVSDAN